jgi:hypothetical protein
MMFAPDSFKRDPYGHLTNQGAHGGLVGVGLALLALPILPPVAAWFAVVLGYFVIWEVVIGARIKEGDLAPSWDWRDSIDDTGNVAGGAAVLIGALAWGYWAALGAFLVWGASLALSTWRRK